MEISQSDLDKLLKNAYKDGYNDGYDKIFEVGRQMGYDKDVDDYIIKNPTITGFPASIQKFTGNLDGF